MLQLQEDTDVWDGLLADGWIQGVTRASWNGTEYGEEYLSLYVGEVLRVCTRMDQGWVFGCSMSRRLQGWLPPSYVKSNVYVQVTTMSGNTFDLLVNWQASGFELKEIVEQQAGIPSLCQVLASTAGVLHDNLPICEHCQHNTRDLRLTLVSSLDKVCAMLHDPSPDGRKGAFAALTYFVELEHQDAIDALLAALTSNWARASLATRTGIDAALAVAKAARLPDDITQVVTQVLAESLFRGRCTAVQQVEVVQALSKFSIREPVTCNSALLHLWFRAEVHPLVQDAADAALITMDPNGEVSRLVAILESLIEVCNDRRSTRVARRLPHWITGCLQKAPKNNDQIISALLDGLKTSPMLPWGDWIVRAAARGNGTVIEALIPCLDGIPDYSHAVHLQVNRVMAHTACRGEERVISLLLRGRPYDAGRLKALDRLGLPPDERILHHALRFLHYLCDGSPDPPDRCNCKALAIRMVGRFATPSCDDAVNAVLTCIASKCETWKVQRAAVHAIAQLVHRGHEQSVAILAAFRASLAEPYGMVERVLEQLPSMYRFATVQRAASKLNRDLVLLKVSTITNLARVSSSGDERLIAAALESLRDGAWQVRLAGVRALAEHMIREVGSCDTDGTSVTHSLQALSSCRSDVQAEVRVAAGRAVARLSPIADSNDEFESLAPVQCISLWDDALSTEIDN